MASHKINIDIINTPLGIPLSADGVMGLVCKAVAVSGKFSLNTAYLLTKVADLETYGIDSDYDEDNNVAVYQHVTEFFSEAGDGAKLWLYGVSVATDFKTFAESDTFKNFIRGTVTSDPLNKVKGIGLCYDVPTAGQNDADFPVDVTDTIPVLQSTLVSLFDEGFECFGVIDGYNMSTSVTSSTIGTLATQSNYKVGVCISGTKANRVSSVGLLLGRLAKITVGSSVGEVAEGAGAITSTTAYLTNNTSIASLNVSDFDSLGDKQYIFLRTWSGYAGYFWNDGATATSPSNAFSSIEYNRVANKLSADARYFFIGKIGAKTFLDDNGNVDKALLNTYIGNYNTRYIVPLVISGDISNALINITGNNFVATKKLTFSIKILPAPAISNVEGTVEFVANL